jgi:hypothetical protein
MIPEALLHSRKQSRWTGHAGKMNGSKLDRMLDVDRDDTDALIRDAEAIGRQNQEIIDLARAWCNHIRRDRGHMGVGIVEETTGLPVSGGTFTCDFARGQSPE